MNEKDNPNTKFRLNNGYNEDLDNDIFDFVKPYNEPEKVDFTKDMELRKGEGIYT